MNSIVYLMCKYAGVPAGAVLRLSKMIPKGTPLRNSVVRGMSSFRRIGSSGKQYIKDILGSREPGALASACYTPAEWLPVHAQRVPSLRRNAMGADAVQYLFRQGAKSPAQREYFEALPVSTGWYQAYSPFSSVVTTGVPTKPSNLHGLGHEMGHARYMTSRLPKSINEYAGLAGEPEVLRLNNSMTKRFGPLALDTNEFLHEVGANQQYYKVMRRALADNPQLFDRWRRNMEMSLLPNLSTYMRGNQLRLGTAMARLPRRLQPAAKAYAAQYEQFMSRVRQYAYKKGISEMDALERMVAIYQRKAQMMDPNLSRDIYNYTVQHGMPVNPNAWYNNPMWR